MSHKTAAELRVVVKVSPESEKEHALKSIVKRNSGESCLVLWPVNTSCQTDCSSVCRSVTHFTRYSTVYKTLTASALEIFSGTLCSSSVWWIFLFLSSPSKSFYSVWFSDDAKATGERKLSTAILLKNSFIQQFRILSNVLLPLRVLLLFFSLPKKTSINIRRRSGTWFST